MALERSEVKVLLGPELTKRKGTVTGAAKKRLLAQIHLVLRVTELAKMRLPVHLQIQRVDMLLGLNISTTLASTCMLALKRILE
jgi:hypothetical protein